MNETFWTLFCNAAHWEFEIFLMLLFDGLIGLLIWPFLKKHWNHHIERDRKESTPAIYTFTSKYQPAPDDRACLLVDSNELQFEGVLPNRIMWGGLGLTVYYNDGHQFTFNVVDVPKVKK